MQFQNVTTIPLALDRQLCWLLPVGNSDFLVGDEKTAYLIPTAPPHAPQQLQSNATADCNLPIPDAMYEQLTNAPWHGFTLLKKQFSRGDLLRTLVFSPDYGLHVQHQATGLILSLRSGSIELLKQDHEGVASIEKTKTRGKAVIAFAAHPTDSLLAYGDNGGTFHIHRFGATGFGKATKIATKDRKASRVEFTRNGQLLFIGGMGYLAAFNNTDGKFTPADETATAVRDFVCLNDGQTIIVNHGTNGISAFTYNEVGFQPAGSATSIGAVNQIAVTACGRFLAATKQDAAELCLLTMNEQ